MDALESFHGVCTDRMAQAALEQRMPLSGTFELLPYCNMHCNMCYIVHDKQSVDACGGLKPLDFWKDILIQAEQAGMLFALFTGGEPFLYPHLRELLEWMTERPVYLVLNTNGTLLTRDTVAWLAKTSIKRVNISLYGASNETYARLCHNPQGFDRVIQTFDLLTEYHIPFRVHCSLTPENYGDYDDIIAVCNRYQTHLQMVYYMFPPYRMADELASNPARFTPQQAAQAARRVKRSTMPDPADYWRFLKASCSCIEHPENYSAYGSNEVACRGGLAAFWVDWRGQLSGCGVNNKEQIDLSCVPFAQAWREVVPSAEQTHLSEDCKYCAYRCFCPICPAAAFCETGSPSGKPAYLCEFAHEYARLLQKDLEELEKTE